MVNALVHHGAANHLVILRQTNAEKPFTALPGIERVTFNNAEELREKLTAAASLTRTAQPSLESQIPDDEDADDAVAGTPASAEEEPTFDLDKNAKEFAADTTPEVITATRTDADIKAAVVVIQRWYRRHLSQRMLLESSEFHGLMQACVKDARNVVHQPRRFRFLAIVRCYLPHILFVLSIILGKIRNKSARAKRHLSIVEPGVEMENCQNQIATFK